MNVSNNTVVWILFFLLLIACAGIFYVVNEKKAALENFEKTNFAIIDKQSLVLSVYNIEGINIANYKIAVGKGFGNKVKEYDMRTPEGIFHVSDIHDASEWKHDFGDGLGLISGAYGSHFIRLSTPGHKGIGIHGTHLPESIGTRATEGCIRLNNDDLKVFLELVSIGMVVVIIPSNLDVIANAELAAETLKNQKKP